MGGKCGELYTNSKQTESGDSNNQKTSEHKRKIFMKARASAVFIYNEIQEWNIHTAIKQIEIHTQTLIVFATQVGKNPHKKQSKYKEKNKNKAPNVPKYRVRKHIWAICFHNQAQEENALEFPIEMH